MDECLVVAAMVLAAAAAASLGHAVYAHSARAGRNLYLEQVAELINASARAVPEGGRVYVYLPRPVGILDGVLGGRYPLAADGTAIGSCIVVERASGVVRVRGC